MKTLKVNKQGDLEFDGSNNLRLIDGKEELKQAIRLTIGAAVGEWFLNLEHGIDWFEVLGQKQPDFNEIRAIIREGLEEEERIDEIEEIDLEMEDRTLQIEIKIIASGEQIQEEIEAVI